MVTHVCPSNIYPLYPHPDVCGNLPDTVIATVAGVTPVEPEYDIACDASDQETILTTLSQIDERETGKCTYYSVQFT